jgi:hypothetical protein
VFKKEIAGRPYGRFVNLSITFAAQLPQGKTGFLVKYQGMAERNMI